MRRRAANVRLMQGRGVDGAPAFLFDENASVAPTAIVAGMSRGQLFFCVHEIRQKLRHILKCGLTWAFWILQMDTGIIGVSDATAAGRPTVSATKPSPDGGSLRPLSRRIVKDWRSGCVLNEGPLREMPL